MIADAKSTLSALMTLLVVFVVPGRSLSQNFYNVLLPNGADPWVMKHSDGNYYMTVTTGRNVTLWRSPTLTGIGGGEKQIVWRPPASGPNSQNIWAPELHYLQGKWYIYYAADNGKNENHRMYVLENDSPDPLKGQFIDKGKIFDRRADRWAIDGTVLEVADKLYFIWSGWEGDTNDRQNLYIAPMKNPFTISGPRIEISRPSLPWEKVGKPHVNEGPQVVVRGQTINLIYSASGSWTDDYCLGLLTAKVGADLLAPRSWKKHERPVFRSDNNIFGPGHASFVKSPDGKEDWIVYHAARFRGAGWTRNVRTQPFTWNSDGTPFFSSPVAPNRPIALPGGERRHDRYEAEQGKLAGKARTAKHPTASGGTKVGYIDSPDSFVELNVNVPKAGRYVMSVRFGNGTEGKRDSSHRVFVNGEQIGEIRYPHSGWDNWANVFRQLELKEGSNTIRFAKGDGFGEIDCLDIFSAQ